MDSPASDLSVSSIHLNDGDYWTASLHSHYFFILSLCYSFQSGMHRFTSPMGLPSWKRLVVFLEVTSLFMSFSTLLRSAYIKIPVIILRWISNAWTASFKSEVTLFKLECNLLEVHVFTLRKQFYFPKIITYYRLCVSGKSESEK